MFKLKVENTVAAYNVARARLLSLAYKWAAEFRTKLTPKDTIAIDGNEHQLVTVEVNRKTLAIRFVIIDNGQLRRRTLKHTEVVNRIKDNTYEVVERTA